MGEIVSIANKDIKIQSKLLDAYGIYGVSTFASILELPISFPFDYMHLVLQGHTKWLIKHLIFEKNMNLSHFSNYIFSSNF